MTTYSNYEELLVEVVDSVATVTMNRPDILNAETLKMTSEFERVWHELDSDPEVKAVILTGAGEKFSVGGDFRSMRDGAWMSPFEDNIFGRCTRRVNDQLTLRVPLITAINGDCIGGGASMALFSDIVVMEESARLGDPHVNSGAVAGDGGVLWSLIVGPLRAKQYLMTGDLMTAAEAFQMGLVSYVVPDGTAYEKAQAVAQRFVTRLAPLAVNWTKYTINKMIRDGISASYDLSLALELITFMSEDRREAIEAFLDKRKPQYKGR